VNVLKDLTYAGKQKKYNNKHTYILSQPCGYLKILKYSVTKRNICNSAGYNRVLFICSLKEFLFCSVVIYVLLTFVPKGSVYKLPDQIS
jgi:hypothetical protein